MLNRPTFGGHITWSPSLYDFYGNNTASYDNYCQHPLICDFWGWQTACQVREMACAGVCSSVDGAFVRFCRGTCRYGGFPSQNKKKQVHNKCSNAVAVPSCCSWGCDVLKGVALSFRTIVRNLIPWITVSSCCRYCRLKFLELCFLFTPNKKRMTSDTLFIWFLWKQYCFIR